MAKQSIVSDIKELSFLNPVILTYVMDHMEPFVTTHHSIIDEEIRYSLINCNHNNHSTKISVTMGVIQ